MRAEAADQTHVFARLRDVRHEPNLASEPVISLEAVTKRWPDGTVAVDDLTLSIADGEVCVLVGPSGCGKTTTMRMINRLVEPTAGRISIDGVDVLRTDPVRLRRGIGYVIQQVGLFPHQTVGENVATVPRLAGWPKAKVRDRVDELLALVGLEPSAFRDRYPHELSGGQRQRVGVARALGVDPPVLLMDEPFGAIDPITRARLQDELLRLQSTLRKTIVFVTHDVDEAVRLGDRIAVFRHGGVLAQVGTPDEVLSAPASSFVADLLGGDRGVKRLAVLPVAAAALEPAAGDELGVVPADASLQDALAAMLLAPDGRVAVVDDAGDVLGVLTPDALHAAARSGQHQQREQHQ